MLADDYRSYCTDLERRGVIFSYRGYVSNSLLEALGDTINRKMQLDGADLSTASRVFAVFVEQVQNIIRYSAEREAAGIPPDEHPEWSSGIITIGREADAYVVLCGNLVSTEDVDDLRARLEQLNGMDKDQLKAFYKERRRQEPREESKGASIGLIDIARKATGPLVFDFLPVEASHAFFFLKAHV